MATPPTRCAPSRSVQSLLRSDEVIDMKVQKWGNEGDTLPRKMKFCKPSLLGHVLRTDPLRLPHRTLFSVPWTRWNKRPGGQQMKWQRDMKNATVVLSRVGSSRSFGWSPKRIFQLDNWIL